MKFDCVVGNPPYQMPKANDADSTHCIKAGAATLWDKFTDMSIQSLVKDNGYVALVHPAGWRRPNTNGRKIGQVIRSRQVLYLELHSIQDGIKHFGATTNYDWYVLRNKRNDGHLTTIKDYAGETCSLCIADLPFIPNERITDILPLLAKNGEASCEIIRDYSSYFTRKPIMSETQSEVYKYPCIYSMPQKGTQLMWSSTKEKGHFGIPKVVFSNGAGSTVEVDYTGKYGLTQFAYGLVDDVENLPSIKKALESRDFLDLCKCFRFTLDKYDGDILRLFRKDFWKEFI